ncbi:hypothetical protein [Serratia symbiotica]|uniref:DUF7609 domain-containing protein n=2 Tax=Serratia symbiotica TaxID=138074 RepID=A0A068ZAC5_9GAMM|nr:hypothetical protein [Serratia symbiotica]MBQ0957225.1 hypothetical protein [Serratia symbiotica]MBQ0957261.1 hypothetical protein [Serratia symbiotica]MBQ0957305.1 hypothetical protein [Serratia symbiotica]QLH62344.1 hypothetical protein SYMBAF_04490 [Serratia symbiotica]QLH62349.1 hypothetical protein SYMBAF_04520 [Serratia symbiotica]
MARTMRYFGHITPPAEKLMTDHPVQPESAEDEIIDIDTEAFAHTVAMMVLLKPGMSHTHSEPLSPDCAAGQLVQDVNSLKKRARRLLVPAMHEATKRTGQVYNIESSLVLYPSGRLFAQAIVTRSR